MNAVRSVGATALAPAAWGLTYVVTTGCSRRGARC